MNADGTETWGEAWEGLTSRVSILGDGRLIWACVTQIIIAWLIGLAIHIVMPFLTGFAYIIGAIIWTVILCFTPAVNLWFIKPLGNHAIVLEHALRKKEKVTDPNQAIRLKPTNAYRIIYGPALTGKSMFESVLGKEAIDLRRALELVANDIKVSTGDGANHTMKFWTPCAPIQTDECLINLARHTESAVVGYFHRSFISYLQRATAEVKTTDDLLAAMSVDKKGNKVGKIAKGFNELFGGKGKVHDDERERGMFTGDPQCELIIDPKFQKVRQATPTATLKRQAINALTLNGGVSPDVAANMVAADVGEEQPAKLTKFFIDAPPGMGSVYIVAGERGNQR